MTHLLKWLTTLNGTDVYALNVCLFTDTFGLLSVVISVLWCDSLWLSGIIFPFVNLLQNTFSASDVFVAASFNHSYVIDDSN